MVIGGNGCGKTTFSRQLAEKLKLPLVHLDKLYWTEDWKPVADEVFDRLLLLEVMKPKWIIDGNISRTIPFRLKYCDTVIYMDFSPIRCVWGSFKRVVTNYGKSRPDVGGYGTEKLDRKKLSFIKSTWYFNKNNRKKYYDMLDNCGNVRVIVLHSRRQVTDFLNSL